MVQLELDFTRRAEAEVLAFPAARMRRHVAETARSIRHLRGMNLDGHLIFAVNDLVYRRLSAAGVDRATIEAEAVAFERAVRDELRRLDVIEFIFGSPDERGGAA